MILLIFYSFLAGIVTILSPCILPILPVVLSSGVTTDSRNKKRPLGVIFGFVASFTFFTLFLSEIVRRFNIPADSLRLFAIIVIGLFGLSLIIPKAQELMEKAFTKLANFMPNTSNKSGFIGGVIVGLSLGLLWTPCVGPILASVISLAITGTVTLNTFVITLAYSLGTAVPMFIIMVAGSSIFSKVPWLLKNTSNIQKGFGVLMIATSIAMLFNIDRQFQTIILTRFPEYGKGLTQLEDNTNVEQELKNLNSELDNSPINTDKIGDPLNELMPSNYPSAPELIQGGIWINSEPLTLAQLEGKVVLIDFWTYTCINCQRTFPYLRNWWDKYKDKGLVIIGVHSPEFEFEKNPNNVKQAALDFKLNYPIMQDNNFATWRAYKNRYWPAKYLIDRNGRVRYTHFGEGAYNTTEEKIQELLREIPEVSVNESINNETEKNFAGTPETYMGYYRLARLASPEKVIRDTFSTYSHPQGGLGKNNYALAGSWLISGEYALGEPGSTLYFDFQAKNVFLVMRPANEVETAQGRVEVLLDNRHIQTIEVNSDSLYQLIELENPGRHLLKLRFIDGNVEIYAFTFG